MPNHKLTDAECLQIQYDASNVRHRLDDLLADMKRLIANRERLQRELESVRDDRDERVKQKGELLDYIKQQASTIGRLRMLIDDFMSYFDPKGGVSDVPLGPFERAKEALAETQSTKQESK